MEQKATSHPINMNFTIEAGSLKKVVEQGRLDEFVDTLSTLAAAHIRAAIVTEVAKGGTNAINVKAGFDDDREFGNGPRGPWPHHSGIYESAMRQMSVNKLIEKTGTGQAKSTAVGRG